MPTSAGKVSSKEIREKVLRQRGLTIQRKAKHSHARIVSHIIGKNLDGIKTTKMLYLEQKYCLLVDQVLQNNSLSQASRKFGGEVDTTTLSKWKLRLGLTYNENNLPSCDGCKSLNERCGYSFCIILYERELYDLIPIKKGEIIGNR